jgi:hypothetical protein
MIFMNTPVGLIQSFEARGIHIGGIYPFRVCPETLKRIGESEIFAHDSAEIDKFMRHRRIMYGPEQRWSDPLKVIYCETTLQKCNLSNGREFKEVPYRSYMSIYPLGFVTMVFWVDLDKHTFKADELIELATLARGTGERIKYPKKASLYVKWKHRVEPKENFVEICELVEAELREVVPESIPHSDQSKKTVVQFAYPIVYIREVPDCESAQDIISKYARVVAGISNLWHYNMQWLKDEEINRMIETDHHPFEYGLNCQSSVCTVELHPTNLQQVVAKRGVTADEHHYRERNLLTFVCEPPVGQVFIMRTFDEELMKIRSEFPSPGRLSFLNIIYLLRLLMRAVRMTKFQDQLIHSMDQFRNIYLVRRSYMPTAIDLLRKAFGTEKVEESVDRRLADLQKSIQMTYSMLTTSFIIILSIVTAILGLEIVTNAIRKLFEWLWSLI